MDIALQKITDTLSKEPQAKVGGSEFKFTVEEMVEKVSLWIEAYKKDGDRFGEVPTLACLAFDLGVASKTVREYAKRDAYTEILERAKTYCEMHTVQKTFDPKIRPGGPIFILKSNFDYKDGSENKGGINFNNCNWSNIQQAFDERRLKQGNPGNDEARKGGLRS